MPVHERYPNYIKDQRKFFDELIVEDWDTYQSKDWDTIRQFEVKELFRHVRPQSVLNIGCGCGFHDKEMALYDFVELVHGIDYSEESVNTANKYYSHEKVSRRVEDLEVAEPHRQYDLVASFQVFEHLENVTAYFHYAKSACTSGGHIAILTPNWLRLRNVLLALRLKKKQLCDPLHFKEYTIRELRRIGIKHGLKHIKTFGYEVSGLSAIDSLPLKRRLALGKYAPILADRLCVIFQKS